MGFWKTWFNSNDGVVTTKATHGLEEHTANSNGDNSNFSGDRIVFSTERDIDLYEL